MVPARFSYLLRATALTALLSGCGLPLGQLGGNGSLQQTLGASSLSATGAVVPGGSAALMPQFPASLGLLGSDVLPASIGIGISVGRAAIAVKMAAPATVGSVQLPAGASYEFQASGGKVSLIENGQVVVSQTSPILVSPAADGALEWNGRRYRGSFEALATPGALDCVTLVDRLPLESYLLGVVPAEMPASWPEAALESQAIAARTYAAANIGRHADQGFDLYGDTRDQAYGGESAETLASDAAVQATYGLGLTYQGRIITALFHASSGGQTDDAIAVWGIDLPYIRGVDDIDISPYAHWTRVLSAARVEAGLAAQGIEVGSPERLSVQTYTAHGRARWLSVTGTAGSAVADANSFRLATGLPSTRYQLAAIAGGWQFTGGGFGHGLGMSQWGAKAYADLGWSYDQILMHYYTGVDLASF